MIDNTTLVLLIFAVFVLIGGVYSLFAVASNGRKNVETLKDANKRLKEMQKDIARHGK